MQVKYVSVALDTLGVTAKHQFAFHLARMAFAPLQEIAHATQGLLERDVMEVSDILIYLISTFPPSCRG